MTPTIHDLQQGSEAWHLFRMEHFGASEAAAMLGLSKKVTRTELLRMKATGVGREFSDWVQKNILDHGHVVEAAARPFIENMISDTLYPVTCSAGKLSASCDGLTLGFEKAFEHKQWAEMLAAMVAMGEVPDEHMPQCQQILMVTGAEEVIFTVSDGTPDRLVFTAVKPDPKWFDRIRTGWAQFEADLANYTPPAAEAPKSVGKAPEALPALRIEVTGAVTASNLDAFKQHALAVFSSISTELATDQDFADAEKTVKWCGDVEERLAAAKQHALSQTESIDALFRAIDDIAAEARSKRLTLEKKVKARKDEIRGEIVAEAQTELDKHREALNARLGTPWIARTLGPFGEAIKGKKTVASLRDACSTTLAEQKIAMSELADRLEHNRKSLVADDGTDWFFLFADFSVVGAKAKDDFEGVAALRIQKHKDEEEQRKKIADAVAEAVAPAAPPAAAPVAAPAVQAPAVRPLFSGGAATPRAAADNRPPITTGTLCARLGEGITLTAAFLQGLGFDPAPLPAEAKSGTYWSEADFPRICRAIAARMQEVAQGVPA